MGRGQTNKQTDIATTRKNRPKGRLFEEKKEVEKLKLYVTPSSKHVKMNSRNCPDACIIEKYNI